jgi:hypothetical protein
MRSFSGHICIKDNQGQLGHLEVMLVSRPVMVNTIIRIKDNHGQSGPLYVLFVIRTVMVNKVLYMSYFN